MTKKEAGARIDKLKKAIDELGKSALFVSGQISAIDDKRLFHTAKILVGISLALHGSVMKHELSLINKLAGKDKKTHGKNGKKGFGKRATADRRRTTGK